MEKSRIIQYICCGTIFRWEYCCQSKKNFVCLYNFVRVGGVWFKSTYLPKQNISNSSRRNRFRNCDHWTSSDQFNRAFIWHHSRRYHFLINYYSFHFSNIFCRTLRIYECIWRFLSQYIREWRCSYLYVYWMGLTQSSRNCIKQQRKIWVYAAVLRNRESFGFSPIIFFVCCFFLVLFIIRTFDETKILV